MTGSATSAKEEAGVEGREEEIGDNSAGAPYEGGTQLWSGKQ